MLELSAAALHYFKQPQRLIISDTLPIVTSELASGELLQLQLLINQQQLIIEARFKAYGCGWLLASAALLCECLEGMSMDAARHFSHNYLVTQLSIPAQKLHCAVLAESALNLSLDTYLAGEHP